MTRLGFFGPAAMIDKVFNAVVFADVKVPGVAGRVAAGFRGIFHRDQLRPNRFPAAVYAFPDRSRWRWCPSKHGRGTEANNYR